MKFSVQLQDFQKLLQNVIQAVPPRSTLPVLENFHLELAGNRLEVIATDQELTIISALEVAGEVDGKVLAPARKLFDIVKALGGLGSLRVAVDESLFKVTLKTDIGEYVLFGLDPAEFPLTPQFEGSIEVKFEQKSMMRIADKCTFAVSKDEYRPALTGVLFKFNADSFNAVSTDSIRLSCLTLHGTEEYPLPGKEFEAIIPARTIDLLKKPESDVSLELNDTHARFEMNNLTIITRIIDERFPAYEAIIPHDNEKMLKFRPADILASIRRVSLFSSAISRQVNFELNPDSWTIIGQDNESGNQATEVVPCEYSDESMELCFNYRYVEEVMAHIVDGADDEALMALSTPSRSVLIKPLVDGVVSNDLLMLVMPSRTVAS